MMTKFAYNNIKNKSTNFTDFKLNLGYHPYMFFEKYIDSHFYLKISNKLIVE